MKNLTLLSAYTVALLLLATGIDKLTHWFQFVRVLQEYPVVPAAIPGAVGGFVVAIEFLIAASLLIANTRRTGFLLAGGLFAVFSGAVLHLLLMREGAPCGCIFAFGDARATIPHAIGNVCGATLCLLLWRSGTQIPPHRAAGGAKVAPPINIPPSSFERIP
jgi:hypothetical protein